MNTTSFFFSGTALACLSVTALQAAPSAEQEPYPQYGEIQPADPSFDDLIAPGTSMEKLAGGFQWTEGPVWRPQQQELLFSDVPKNTVYRWKQGEGIQIFLRPSGFTGESYQGHNPGSNGLMLDREGNLTLCQHGDRRIARLNETIVEFETIADSMDGKHFNSPNDLIFDQRGNLYFTDPPYGWAEEVPRDLDYSGVYRVSADGTVSLLTKEIPWPNGIALSLDEKTLYVSNSGWEDYYITAYPLTESGLGQGTVIFDATPFIEKTHPGSTDGMCVDANGNIWTTGPGGVYVLSPKGKHLGTLYTGQPCGNCAFGDDGYFYIMSNNDIARVKTLAISR